MFRDRPNIKETEQDRDPDYSEALPAPPDTQFVEAERGLWRDGSLDVDLQHIVRRHQYAKQATPVTPNAGTSRQRCEPSLAADHNRRRAIPASAPTRMITPAKIQVTSYWPVDKLPIAAE